MDISAIEGQLDSLVTTATSNVQAAQANLDINDPTSLTKYQQAINQYTQAIGLDSAMSKAIKDMIMSIISKIG